jgi:hypothetical protein
MACGGKWRLNLSLGLYAMLKQLLLGRYVKLTLTEFFKQLKEEKQ